MKHRIVAEIERWLSELHDEFAESSVSSYFALFSTILNGAVRARMIPANPCNGVRVTNGEFDTERLVATRPKRYDLGLGQVGIRAVPDGFLYRRSMG